MDPAVVWIGMLSICAGAFWLTRKFAMRLNWTQRKLMIYMLAFAPLIPLAADGKGIGGSITIISGLLVIPAIFAVILAPVKT
jgi:hypothetical protein